MSLILSLVVILLVIFLINEILKQLTLPAGTVRIIQIVVSVLALLYLIGVLGGYVPALRYP